MRDMGPARKPLASLEHLLDRPMNWTRFAMLSDQLFCNLGVSAEDSLVSCQTYSARRTHPTIGGCRDQRALKVASTGNWQCGAMSRDVAQEVARLKIPFRNNDARLTWAARAKCETIVAARLCAEESNLSTTRPWKSLVLELASAHRSAAAVGADVQSYS